MKPEDILISSTYTISKITYDHDPHRAINIAETCIRQRVADEIVKSKSITDVTDHYVIKRLDVYVATPEEFWQIVNDKARELAFMFNPINFKGEELDETK